MKRRTKRIAKSAKAKRTASRVHKKPTSARSGQFEALKLKLAQSKAELRQLNVDLAESLEQQAATSEVLKLISNSPGKLNPVFSAILENAVRICGARFGTLLLTEANGFRVVSLYGASPEYIEERRLHPMISAVAGSGLARVTDTKKPIQIADIQKEAAYRIDPGHSALSKMGGARTLLTVPMLKDDRLIGAIAIYRQEVRPFSDKQVEVVSNFAKQAVIAIENTRVLNELRETLNRQTATSEVLKVISSSPGDLEPVFQAMLANATRICEAKFGVLWLYDGEVTRLGATHGVPERFAKVLTARGAIPAAPGSPLRRILDAKDVIHSADESAEPLPGMAAKYGGARSLVGVPLLNNNEIVGAFIIYRQEVRPFSDKQIELVQNFAAQAVIAIENARLLNELRQRTEDLSQRTNELTEALEQQTATSEVLRVISSSPGDLQPVFDTMLENATRICDAKLGILWLPAGDGYTAGALHGAQATLIEVRQRQPVIHPGPLSPLRRAAATKQPVHLADVTQDASYKGGDPSVVQFVETTGVRTHLLVPMLKDRNLAGAISIYRQEVRPFADKQIELVQNFAAQAVIAIENARLLNELRQRTDDLTESLDQQTATSEVLGAIAGSSGELEAVFQAMLRNATRLCGANFASLFRYENGAPRLMGSLNVPQAVSEFLRSGNARPTSSNAFSRMKASRTALHIVDYKVDPAYVSRDPVAVAGVELGGIRTLLIVPMLKDDEIVGAFGIFRQEVKPFTDKQIELVQNFAAQAVIAIENARLLNELRQRTVELESKGRELAEASQHKSQFLANMSHELRTPLNAILGYTELIIDGIYGEAPEKAQVVLKRVESNGRHLLGLINDVLDLSKIEAGQLKLSLVDYSMKDLVYNVVSAVEPLATKKNLRFKVDVPAELPAGHGDEKKLTQVLLNLAGNAIKFTDTGEVAIKATATHGAFSVAIQDTGPGISPTDQTKLFQQFQQADNSITKTKGGTGLGLAISKKIIELHGGNIAVESAVGRGSTFTFTLPVRVEQQAGPP